MPIAVVRCMLSWHTCKHEAGGCLFAGLSQQPIQPLLCLPTVWPSTLKGHPSCGRPEGPWKRLCVGKTKVSQCTCTCTLQEACYTVTAKHNQFVKSNFWPDRLHNVIHFNITLVQISVRVCVFCSCFLCAVCCFFLLISIDFYRFHLCEYIVYMTYALNMDHMRWTFICVEHELPGSGVFLVLCFFVFFRCCVFVGCN